MLPSARPTARLAGVTAALGLALTLTAGPAQAADDWQTIDRIAGSRLQACRVPVGDGRAWRLELRVKAGDGWARGRVVVREGGEPTDRRWRSGLVEAGETSEVGHVRINRGRRWSLETGVDTENAGSVSVGMGGASVNRC